MQSRRIASTPLDGLIALGRPSERDVVRLAELLSSRAHSAGVRFAEPVPTRDGQRVDWYVETSERPVALESLEPARQAAVVAAVEGSLADLRREGERLLASGDERGGLLVVAAQTPTPLSHFIYLGEDGVPVLICWGYAHDWQHRRGATPEIRVQGPPEPAREPPVLVSVPALPARGWRWWWPFWLLLALLLLAIAWLLLQACGVNWPGRSDWQYCRPGAAALAAELESGRALEEEAHRLRLALIEHQTACFASRPPPLPKDRWLDKDLAILDGCWTLGRDAQTLVVNDLGNQEQCTVRAGTICFKTDGTGTREITTDCGSRRFSVCKAPVTARFNDDGALETEQPETKCDPATITWHGPPNRLVCKRVEEGGALCRDGVNFEHEFKPKSP